MSSLPRGEEIKEASDSQKEAMPMPIGLGAKIEGQYRKIKEHAETYPYVWGSYILVYGGLGLWLTYRWRKLRKTEDRVRVLQDRLRKLVEAEQPPESAMGKVQSSKPTSLADKTPSSADKS